MADIGSLLGAAGIGGNIGKAIVQLELDTTKYAGELKSAETKTVASTQKMGSSTSKLSSLSSTAYLAIGAAAVAGLGYSVNAAVEAQEAQERLHNTIKNAPQLAASAEQAFLDQAEAIRSVTGADDEAIISGQALLGNMGLLQGQITDLTPLVVDLATKYDIDLQSAFKAVGKAATGSTGALSRYVGAIEKGATPAETLQNVLDKLGGSAGFAAEQAKSEPWRLLQSDLEELSESIGTAVLPVLRRMADVLKVLLDNLEPVVIALAGFAALRYLPGLLLAIATGLEAIGAARVASGILNVAAAVEGLGAGFATLAAVDLAGLVYLIQKIATGGDPSFVPKLSAAVVEIAPHLEGFSDQLDDIGTKGQQARERIVNFAHKTDAELKKWSEDTKASFDDFVGSLQDATSETEITRKDFRDAIHDMLLNARDLSQAMNRLSKEHWVNDDFITFLSEQGPEWLIAFADQTEKQQRRAQDEWEKSTKKTDAAKDSLDRMSGVLDQLDKGTSKHTVEIHYKYVGFDPTKPGMGSPQQPVGHTGP